MKESIRIHIPNKFIPDVYIDIDQEDKVWMDEFICSWRYSRRHNRVCARIKKDELNYRGGIARVIMLYYGHDIEGKDVDHINLNPLDNRKDNLRICSHLENCRNRNKHKVPNFTSQFKGVAWDKDKWSAMIANEGKRISIGRFESEKDAAVAYDLYAKDLFGEFALLNFDNHPEESRVRDIISKSTRYKRKGCSSQYKGVHISSDGKITASIYFDKKVKYLGSFDSEKEAAAQYNVEALKLIGPTARLNEL